MEGIISKKTHSDGCAPVQCDPRKVIASVAGRVLIETGHRYDRSFCCGAGGGRFWMEESTWKRINVARVEEARSVTWLVCMRRNFKLQLQ
ncbi:MAG: heterodisulfide reductase-related iron-sulfur binding cluster [Methanobacteriota archaeon]